MGDGNEGESKNKVEDNVIETETGTILAIGNDPSAWIMATFSPQWFRDALHEATSSADEYSIRREIVFSSCFLESYIFEWVRDIDIKVVDDYFPQDKQHPRFGRKLVEKWKYVPKELSAEKNMGVDPALSLSLLGDLNGLRNALVHSSVSRPTQLGKKSKKLPPREALRKKKAGWALGIAVKLVEELHGKFGTAAPAYLKEWKMKP